MLSITKKKKNYIALFAKQLSLKDAISAEICKTKISYISEKAFVFSIIFSIILQYYFLGLIKNT